MNRQPFKSSICKLFPPLQTAGRNWFCFSALTLCLGLLFSSQAHAACGYYVTAGNPGQNVMSASDSAYHTFSAYSGQSHHSSDMPQCHAGNSNSATTAAVPSSSDEQGVGLCSEFTTPHILISSAPKSHDSSHQPEVYLPLFDPPPRSPALSLS